MLSREELVWGMTPDKCMRMQSSGWSECCKHDHNEVVWRCPGGGGDGGDGGDGVYMSFSFPFGGLQYLGFRRSLFHRVVWVCWLFGCKYDFVFLLPCFLSPRSCVATLLFKVVTLLSIKGVFV